MPAAHARARRSLSLPLPEDRAAAGRGAGARAGDRLPVALRPRQMAASRRPTPRLPSLAEGGEAARRGRRARVFGRLPRDARGAGDPRPRDLPRRRAAPISPICPASTQRDAGHAKCCAASLHASLQAGWSPPSLEAIRNEERNIMARVAIVTGGTRGIGEAISVALQDAGMTVAANYAGNDEKAPRLHRSHRHQGLSNGTSAISTRAPRASRRSRPSSGRSTCWSTMPASPATARSLKMTHEMWEEVIDVNLGGCFNMAQGGVPGDARAANGAASSTSARSTARPGNTARSTMPPPNRASTASPRRWRRKARAPASLSTRSRRAISIPTWSRRCRPKCWRRSSPRFRSAGWGSAERDRARRGLPVLRRSRLRHRIDPVDQRRPAHVLNGRRR